MNCAIRFCRLSSFNKWYDGLNEKPRFLLFIVFIIIFVALIDVMTLLLPYTTYLMADLILLSLCFFVIFARYIYLLSHTSKYDTQPRGPQ